MTNQELIQLLSTVIALVAVIVGSMVTLRVAKPQVESAKPVADLQVHANVLSKNRQDWINTLRLEIAAFMSDVTMILPLLVSGKDSMEMHKLLAQSQLHLSRAKLLINPLEEDHTVLIARMEEVWAHVMEFKAIPSELNAELVAIAQSILKREWERVKAFA